MSKPRALDLFCGAGGATRGLQQAGYIVHGVDFVPQPCYCGEQFTQADALTYGTYEWFRQFDLVWASPPCQAHTTLRSMWNARKHEDLIAPTRARLSEMRVPYVMENVPGSTLDNDMFFLCGSMFGLGVEVYDGWRQLRRHRWFEASFKPLVPPCHHTGPTIGIYGDHARDRRRKPGVRDRGVDFPDNQRVALARVALDMPWADWKGLSQAIPPAYSEFIGRQAIAVIGSANAVNPQATNGASEERQTRIAK